MRDNVHVISRSRRAITLVETVLSTLIVSMVIVSTLQVVPPIVRSSALHAEKMVAANLARELAEEVGTKPFTDPTDSSSSVGVNAGESASLRSDFDDVDDYHLWSASPPESSFEKMTNIVGWERAVKVIYVQLDDPNVEVVGPTNLKLVTVTVSRNGVELASVQTLHTLSADRSGFLVSVGE